MPYSPLLGPVVALIAWTVIILIWMLIARTISFNKAGIRLTKLHSGARGPELEPQLDPKLNWKAHNYNHLMEQPTIFYAVCFALILMHFDAPINVWLAWGYVAFRILHSLVQTTANIVWLRFSFFALSSLCLIGLTTHAALRLILGH